jgi:hypothetical protein
MVKVYFRYARYALTILAPAGLGKEQNCRLYPECITSF